MLCSVYTTIAGEYDGPGFCTPIGTDSSTVQYNNRILTVDLFMYLI